MTTIKITETTKKTSEIMNDMRALFKVSSYYSDSELDQQFPTPRNTIMPPLQTLQSRIAELVPEVKELKFGCEIIHNGKVDTIVKVVERKCYRTIDRDFLFLNNGSPFETLGSPITLADVLRAIGEMENNALRSFPRNCTVDARGMITAYWSLTDRRSFMWDLTTDLSHQSEATHRSLLELLA